MKNKKALRLWFIYVVMPLGIPAVLGLIAWLVMQIRGGQLGGYDFGLLMVLAYLLVVSGFNLTARQVDADSDDEKLSEGGDISAEVKVGAPATAKAVKWYESPLGTQGFIAGFISVVALALFLAIFADWGKGLEKSELDKNISNLLKQDVATLVVKRLKDGANSKDFTPEQLQHYYDNRILYREIERRIITEKNAELAKQVRGSY